MGRAWATLSDSRIPRKGRRCCLSAENYDLFGSANSSLPVWLICVSPPSLSRSLSVSMCLSPQECWLATACFDCRCCRCHGPTMVADKRPSLPFPFSSLPSPLSTAPQLPLYMFSCDILDAITSPATCYRVSFCLLFFIFVSLSLTLFLLVPFDRR